MHVCDTLAQEAKLALLLSDALGASAADRERAKHWRQLLHGAASGVFHEVMAEVS